MKCSCVWLVVSVGAHNFHVECGSLGGGGIIYIYIYVYIYILGSISGPLMFENSHIPLQAF